MKWKKSTVMIGKENSLDDTVLDLWVRKLPLISWRIQRILHYVNKKTGKRKTKGEHKEAHVLMKSHVQTQSPGNIPRSCKAGHHYYLE